MKFLKVYKNADEDLAWSTTSAMVLPVTVLIYLMIWPLSSVINSAVAQSGLLIPFEVGVPVTFVFSLLVSFGIVALGTVVASRSGASAVVADEMPAMATPPQAVGWFIKRDFLGVEVPPEGIMLPLIHMREPEGWAHMTGDAFLNARVEIVPNSVRLSDGWMLGWKGVYELPDHYPIRSDKILWLDANGEIWIARLHDPINDPDKVKVGAVSECRRLP